MGAQGSPKTMLLFGGTFDPIHFGHLATAAAALAQTGADHVTLMPAATSPFKQGAAISDGHHRLAMIKLAIAHHPGFLVSDLELKRPPPSYTIDTIEAIERQHANTNIALLIGADQLPELCHWRHISQLLRRCDLVVLPRPGALNRQEAPDGIDMAAWMSRQRLWVQTPLMDVSASEVRRRVAAGQSIGGLVPAAVERYINNHAIYRNNA